jgi:ABC-type branched-subunit amino acid transport system ATPase component
MNQKPPLALKVTNVSKNFGGKRALVSASLDLTACNIHGVIGPNGSGKSTLIGTIAGTVLVNEGSIYLDDRDVTRVAVRDRACLGIGRTFQTPHIFESLTLRQHIELADYSANDNWGYAVAEQLCLQNELDRKVGTFSHGLRRMSEICHVAATRPKVLLLDEPAAGLTEREMKQLAEVLGFLRKQTTICLVEHNMGFLLGLVDNVTVLEHGQVIACGTPDHIVQNDDVRRAYLGTGFSCDQAQRSARVQI